MQTEIPLYKAVGELCDRITPARMARLEKLDLIQIVRHKKGHVSRRIVRQRPGHPPPARLTDYIGTRYSFREHLENGHICWRLRRLGREHELRPIFLQVVTGCLARS
ncbi:MAG: hypothetical protein HY821_09965 [Acidobacteria bacterium]|nr:hypothetical protein [Acidobacteriota bacterium]